MRDLHDSLASNRADYSTLFRGLCLLNFGFNPNATIQFRSVAGTTGESADAPP